MTRKYFGTDGIRGRVGEHPITAEFVLRLGWAAGKVFSQSAKSRKLILVGKDTRVSGYMFESALQAGIIAAGVDVELMGPMPTPAVAYLTRTFRAQAGIVISASHNPFDDNGIKFFAGDGYKLPDEVELEIEHYIDQPIVTAHSQDLGRAHRIDDAAGRYIEFCKGTLPSGFVLDGLKIVLDCANGATYHVAPSVFRELGAQVIRTGAEPDGFNINLKCGSTSPEALQQTVLLHRADLGIAFDGDGDRVLFVDHKGELVDGDELLFIIASHRQRMKGCNGVAGTLMTNYGFELAVKELKIPFVRTRVGDRYVIEAMRERGWQLGGESSGHIVCGDLNTTGDAVVSALQVLRAAIQTGRTVHELKKGMRKLPQTMINVRVAGKLDLTGNAAITRAVSQAEQALAGAGRVLLRASGTEPVVRVMVEGSDDALVSRLAQEVAEVVQKAAE